MNPRKLWSEIRSDLFHLNEELESTLGEGTKDELRQVHARAVHERRLKEIHSMQGNPLDMKKYFIHGSRVNLDRIDPEIVPVERGREYSDMFKAASLFWSVPLSRGYGRRMRFVIFDRHHESIIGILGLMDPVFNLRTRDGWIGWDLESKYKRLKSVMDCHILGAVPPYNSILGGKLIVSLAFSSNIRTRFRSKYRGVISKISKTRHDGKLVLLTVMSALGRSSIYNRVSLPWGQRCQSVGFTEGYGVFHIDDQLFAKIREALELEDHPYARAYKFGQGPSWKMRVIRYALEKTNMPDMLRHRIRREVFVLPLGGKSKEFLRGEASRMNGFRQSSSDIAEYWKERWAKPRFERDRTFSGISAAGLYLSRLSLGEDDPIVSPHQAEGILLR